jgi:hypothetical protein
MEVSYLISVIVAEAYNLGRVIWLSKMEILSIKKEGVPPRMEIQITT